MKLREVKIKNFRGIEDVIVPINDTTILIGQNNCGKTAFLEALRLSLRRYNLSKTEIFEEYDYHMSTSCKSPQECAGITIELWFREDRIDEWPTPLAQSLEGVIQYNPSGLKAIGIRLESKYNSSTKVFDQDLKFLQFTGMPLHTKGNPGYLFNIFLTYVQFFYLQPIRDTSKEFSSKSQYWGKILKNMNIPEEKRSELNQKLGEINEDLIQADPQLSQIVSSISRVQKLIERSNDAETILHALPVKPWDLMSKAEVVIKNGNLDIEIPLFKHGQGTQSLSVIYLFNSYIESLLKLVFKAETEAILAIEEPEAHLHPHASRSLAKNLHELKGQKIISSHSPYFIQEIPFKDIRLFRRIGNSIKVLHLKEIFSTEIPANDKLKKFCIDHAPNFYHDGISLLTVHGKIDERDYKKLLKCCIDQPDEDKIAKKIKNLFEESQSFIPDEDIPPLQTYIKRIRGEILFAKGWLLCEGQSECYLLPYFAELLGRPLDEFGISLIDFKNNGSAGSFTAIARVFEIPWIMICDTDPAGEGYKTEVKKRGFSDSEIQMRIKSYPESDLDIELFLIRNGFLPEYLELITLRNKTISRSSGDEGYEKEILDIIQNDKTGYMLDLIDLLKRKGMDSSRIPPFFIDPINKITLKEGEHDHRPL